MMGNPKTNSFQIDICMILVYSRRLFFDIFDPRTDFSYIRDAKCENSLSIVSVKSNA